MARSGSGICLYIPVYAGSLYIGHGHVITTTGHAQVITLYGILRYIYAMVETAGAPFTNME